MTTYDPIVNCPKIPLKVEENLQSEPSSAPNDHGCEESSCSDQQAQEAVPEIPEFWTEENDKRLVKFTYQCRKHWKKVAHMFQDPRITPLAVKRRYEKIEESKMKQKNGFSKLEDILLAVGFEKYGSKWCQITAQYFPFKTPMMVKNRFYGHIQRKRLLEPLLEEFKRLGGDITADYSLEHFEKNEEFAKLKNEQSARYVHTTHNHIDKKPKEQIQMTRQDEVIVQQREQIIELEQQLGKMREYMDKVYGKYSKLSHQAKEIDAENKSLR
eukprot:CAMPEP_0114586024 /NCGR_PEP_ID=MMETSP0125-20121206/9379_1 /TAXON_ID=485358 ORGANISM="Aristerostoma sp., Strain ATCC 50986" /NCGR_SAMPLE_ID=MMETSP0125 /ASSEMBLY_ACC=CAM_ASM_000245 /LENGTH=269 /DNA_ID=CAMNT_0001781311 /DNA_START=205 /DNA_END=1014 /DNA_ORIENTATION=-